jgi:hypothetical protein
MTVVRRFITMTFCLIAIQLSCAAPLALAAGTSPQRAASSSDWVFVSAWPAQSGSGITPREEVWAGAGPQGQWRRIRDREVAAAADTVPVARELVQSLRAAARQPAVYRPWGSRQGNAPDAAVGKYLVVAVGSGDAFEQWADEERFLDGTLVGAAHALIERMRPSTNDTPPRGSAWLQAVTLPEPILTILTRENQITALSPDAVAALPVLGRVVGFPFSWTPIPAGPFRLTPNITLGPDNPSAVVRVRNHVFQILFQMVGTAER